MTSWIWGVLGTGAGALLIWLGTKVWQMILCRNEDHRLMRSLPEVFAAHKEEHSDIKKLLQETKTALDENRQDNMELQKRQLLDSYERAKDRGYWSTYEKQSWNTMFDRYRINNGNSFIEDLHEHEIDKIPIR